MTTDNKRGIGSFTLKFQKPKIGNVVGAIFGVMYLSFYNNGVQKIDVNPLELSKNS